MQDIELAANSQWVSERLYNLLAVGEGGQCPKRVDGALIANIARTMSSVLRRTTAQSVKLVRNALAVCCIERGTVCSWVARRHEVAQRRHALWPAATCRLPQVGPDQRLWAMRKCLFDRGLMFASLLIRACPFTR
jgi:hypothetical protein